ncbi:MAG: hypothetical protein IJ035_09540 [Oscillospiraceae bacterium]|nr:hypothetical protein [Oscillospiraceae bacterium]
MIKAVTLTGTEQEVAFAWTHTIYWVQNLGGGDVLVGLEPELADGKDDVLIVPSGGTGYVRLDAGTKTVYLSGTGKVQVYGTNNAFCPFKGGVKGGDYITSSDSEITAGTVDYPLLALNLYGACGDDGLDIVVRGVDDINVISYRTAGSIITSQPMSAIAKIDDTVTFSVDGGTSYQWQQDTSGDGNFTNIDTVTGRSKSFNITGATFRDGYKYRCIVTDSEGNSETSNIATLYVMSADWSGTSGSVTAFAFEPLRSVENYCDEIAYWVDGTGKVIRCIKKLVFDGSEKWVQAAVTGKDEYRYLYLLDESEDVIHGDNFTSSTVSLIASDRYSAVSNSASINGTEEGISCAHVTGGSICIYDTDFATATIDEWKAHLAANPLTVLYVLDVPMETEFTAAEMAAWQKLQTWNGVTVISNSAGARMSAAVATNPLLSEYVMPVIEGITARYEARIAALEAAVTNN